MRTFLIAFALLLGGCATTNEVVHLNAHNERHYMVFPDPDSVIIGEPADVAKIGGKGKGLGVEDEALALGRSVKIKPGRTATQRPTGHVVPPSRPGHT
jgi:hypothetical protein